MVPENALPEGVLRFIEVNIDTVPQLETLLMMSQAEHRDWKVDEVAARNYITEMLAAETLEALSRRGLVQGDVATGCRFAPASPAVRALVMELVRCYQANLSLIAKIIHSKPSASIKEFARAFDFKKDRS